MNSKTMIFSIVATLVAMYTVFGALNENYVQVAIVFGAASLLFIKSFDKLALWGFCVTSFSAILLPLPGTPFLWEAFMLFSWVGLGVSFGNSPRNFLQEVSKHPLILIGFGLFFGFYLWQMLAHGVGFMALGGGVTGGRNYFRQIVCVTVPVLAVCTHFKLSQLKIMVVALSLSTFTYLVSDLWAMFSLGGQNIVFKFLSPPFDTLAYAAAYEGGHTEIQRLQSFNRVSLGLMFLWCSFFRWKQSSFSRVLVFMFGAGIIIFLAALSGQRGHLALLVVAILVYLIVLRKLSFNLILFGGTITMCFVAMVYLFASELPLSMQRTFSVLPGIKIEDSAARDGEFTANERRDLRIAGLELIPDYFWKGRSFGVNEDYAAYAEQTDDSHAKHLARNAFLNGPIGTFVCCGVGGFTLTLFVMAVMFIYINRTTKMIRYSKQSEFPQLFAAFVIGWTIAKLVVWCFITGGAPTFLYRNALSLAMICMGQHALIQFNRKWELQSQNNSTEAETLKISENF